MSHFTRLLAPLNPLARLTLLAFLAQLAACASPQDQARRTIERLGPYCEALGYTAGSDKWLACIQTEHARRDAIINAQ